MCDFLIFLQPQKNKIRYEFSMWRSPEMGEGPHVRMMSFGCCYQDLVVSHVNSNFAVIKIVRFHM